jgi:hypothetical protein
VRLDSTANDEEVTPGGGPARLVATSPPADIPHWRYIASYKECAVGTRRVAEAHFLRVPKYRWTKAAQCGCRRAEGGEKGVIWLATKK